MPQCSHFPSCGGCTLQNLPYQEQLAQKQAAIQTLFPSALPIIPCDDPWHYRNKMEFSFSQNKAGEKFLGLVMRKSRGKVFHLHECLISPPWFSDMLATVRRWWENTDQAAYHFHHGTGTLRTLTIREGRHTGQKMVMLTVSGDPRFALTKPQIDSFVAAVGDPSISLFLRIQQCIPKQPTQFFEMHLSGPTHIEEHLHIEGQTLRFKISPSSFFQPNTLQAEKLYAAALHLAAPSSSMQVLDLYCGTATIGLTFASHVAHVSGIELNPYAVFDAKENAEINGISNFSIQRGDVGQLISSLPKPDLVIVDPPRPGLDAAALAGLQALRPSQIIYIACNPTTQAQNIAALSDYTVDAVQPVDQFPHTHHIENIVALRRH
ncbi:MAG: 23S rRNA (uracil(1939)-C(5))-methyltransferase RlmD [Verrucomicrobia bacterium]|nr:23S rRNA (uracil(1939)-C(5))-methyltransferase RlmD [Verrucomicrobiota bacterium]